MTRFLKGSEELCAELARHDEVYMVYDLAVESFADALADRAGMDAVMALDIVPGCKTMDSVLRICSFLLQMEAGRDALLLSVGGGTLTDIAGFAAAIYKRGIDCAYVPTTLLAQVDASIGGKTGVNYGGLKNMLGTFSEPCFVCFCSEPLHTLPHRDLVSGYAEMLKTFLIADAEAYREAVRLLPDAGPDELEPFIEKAARIKSEIVARDPFEKGVRRSLNLGHTFAHAVEWYESVHGVADPLTHGEAVASGIIAAARLSESRGVAAPGLAESLKRDFAACGLPVELPYPVEELEKAMHNDKKSIHGAPRFVLIAGPGEVVF